MNPLLMLLGQQVGVDAAEPLADDIPLENNIAVNGKRPVKLSAEDNPNAAVRLIGNTNSIQAAQQAIEKGREVSDRRGMFGVKGTLRDILGLVGDAFLIQGGANPIYMPRRDKERMADAWAGATDDPIAAAERVAYYDPQMAAELKKEYETNLLRQAQQQSLEDTRQSQIEARNYNLLKDGRALAQRILAQPGAFGPDGQLSTAARSLIATAAQNARTTVEGLIGQDMTPEALRLFGEADMTVNQQRNLPIAKQRADASTSQARSSAIRAARPPAGRAPRAESDREAAIRIGNKPPEQRTEGEKAFYEKYTRPPGSGKTTRTLRSDPLGTRATPRFGPPRN